MKNRMWLTAAVILLTVAILVTACGGEKTTPTPTSTPTTTPTSSPTPTPKPYAEKTLTLGGVPGTSSTHIFFTTLGQVLNDAIFEIDFVVKDSLGSQSVMNGILSKKYDFGQSLASVEYTTYSQNTTSTPTPNITNTPGDNASAAALNTDLRHLFSWSTQVMTIAVTKASGIKTVADLKDKNIRVGLSGNYTETVARQIFGALSIQPKYEQNSLDNVASDLKNAKIDGYIEFVLPDSPDTTFNEVQKDTPMKLLSFTPEDIQKVVATYPSMTAGKIEAGVYENMGEIDSFTIVATIATLNDSLTEDEAYRIVKAVWEGKDTLSAAYPAFAGYNLPDETIATSLIPLHAGTYKYFKELGLTVPDALIPPEAK